MPTTPGQPFLTQSLISGATQVSGLAAGQLIKSDGSKIQAALPGQDFIGGFCPYLIQVLTEQMLVISVKYSSPTMTTLTVVRGYNGTTALSSVATGTIVTNLTVAGSPTTTLSGAIGSSGSTTFSITSLSSLKVKETCVYIAPSSNTLTNPIGVVYPLGNDITGDGSLTAPWASLQRALDYLGNYWIHPLVQFNIYASPGLYSSATAIVCSHPCGSSIYLRSVEENAVGVSFTGFSWVGTAGASNIILTGITTPLVNPSVFNYYSNATLSLSDWIAVTSVAGSGTNREYLLGCYPLVAISGTYGGWSLTLANSASDSGNVTRATGTISGTFYPIKARFVCTSATTPAIKVQSTINIGANIGFSSLSVGNGGSLLGSSVVGVYHTGNVSNQAGVTVGKSNLSSTVVVSSSGTSTQGLMSVSSNSSTPATIILGGNLSGPGLAVSASSAYTNTTRVSRCLVGISLSNAATFAAASNGSINGCGTAMAVIGGSYLDVSTFDAFSGLANGGVVGGSGHNCALAANTPMGNDYSYVKGTYA